MDEPTKLINIEKELYPFTIDFFKDDILIHSIYVDGPGAINIPHVPTDVVRVTYANGLADEHIRS